LFASTTTDGKIEDAATASYNYRTVLEGHVTVKSNDGVVTLTGVVQDKQERDLAEDTVGNLPGVMRVDNMIEIKSDVPEHSDGWIALKVRGQLLVKANVSAASTKVDVKDGVVTLTGTAVNIAQSDLTAIYAREVDNVKSVRNEIVIETPAAGSSTAGEVIDDASITSQVKFSLLSHGSTSALATKVTTENSVVNISGTATSDAQKALVTKLAQDTRGVKSVVNGMTVKA
jgi:osmotically-inducible protein OsmY